MCGKLFFYVYTRDNLEIKKSLDLHEKSLEMADKVFCTNTKNKFTNVIIGGALVVLCP